MSLEAEAAFGREVKPAATPVEQLAALVTSTIPWLQRGPRGGAQKMLAEALWADEVPRVVATGVYQGRPSLLLLTNARLILATQSEAQAWCVDYIAAVTAGKGWFMPRLTISEAVVTISEAASDEITVSMVLPMGRAVEFAHAFAEVAAGRPGGASRVPAYVGAAIGLG